MLTVDSITRIKIFLRPRISEQYKVCFSLIADFAPRKCLLCAKADVRVITMH